MSDKIISERIWMKIHDHDGLVDDDFDCIAHDAEAFEKEVEKLKNDKINLIKELTNRWSKVEALEKEVSELKLALVDKILDTKIKYDPKVVLRRINELKKLLKL